MCVISFSSNGKSASRTGRFVNGAGTAFLGILGIGGIFESHARALSLNKEYAEVVAVANAVYNDEIIDRCCKLLDKKQEDLHFFSGYQELIDKTELDAVIVLLPHHLHAPAAIYAAEHGLHVLVEKPMARSTVECDAMIAAAEKNGVSIVVCHDRRYNDEWKAVKELIDSGAVGTPVFFRLEHNQNYAPDGWVKNAEMLGGGAIMSCLTHQIDALRWIGGEMKNLMSMSKIMPERMEGETIGIIAGHMESGALAELTINWHTITDVSVNSITKVKNTLWFELIHICGTKGEVYYMANKGVFYIKYKTPGGAHEYEAGLEGFSPYFKGGNVFGHNNLITAWLDMLRGKNDKIITYGRDARNTIAIAEAAYQSVSAGKTVEVYVIR